jgi:SHS2 domain-containing protein
VFEILEYTADIGFRAEAREAWPLEAWLLEALGTDTESLLVNRLSGVLWLLGGKRTALGRFGVAQAGEGRDPLVSRMLVYGAADLFVGGEQSGALYDQDGIC